MTVGKLEDAEKIVQMTEWNDMETWEYSEHEEATQDNNLAAAKRYLAAQSFLLSWQEGKVPTGWRRPRRLTDFDGKYPQAVVDTAEEMIAERMAERTQKKTARLNAVISAREKRRSQGAETVDQQSDVNNKHIGTIKTQFSSFNHEFFEVKSTLSKATAAIADISFRIQALSEVLK